MAKKKQIRKHHVAFVIDTSSSMYNIIGDVVKMYNTLVKSLPVGTLVSLYEFNNRVHVHYRSVVKPVELTYLVTNGMTALFDATAKAINDQLDVDNDRDTFLVIILTDGQENNSVNYHRNDPYKLIELFNKVHRTDRWTVTFQVPERKDKDALARMGIPTDNIKTWKADKKGVDATTHETTHAIDNYFTNLGKGATRSMSFYADVDKSVVKKLPELTSDFKSISVKDESIIKALVEEKTKKDYQIGSTFYQLTKTEKIQDYKEILVRDRKTKQIFGGRAALNLPNTGDVRVKPGDSGNYDIFVQSTSVNRKLPRGTCVLVRKSAINSIAAKRK